VIVVDANVLLYAYNPASRHHESCRAWLEDSVNGTEPVGLPWQAILAFLRISTSSRVFERPLDCAEAVRIVDEWLACPMVTVVEPSQDYWRVLKEQLRDAQISGPLVSDAALASLALEHGATLCTTDRDYQRFHGLRLLDPLARS
jgi:toxin-antitoxin system PIN domain toxin